MLERLTKLLREYKADDNLAVTADTAFADLGLDSLDTVELIMNVEEEFGVAISMDEPIKTVGALLELIEKND